MHKSIRQQHQQIIGKCAWHPAHPHPCQARSSTPVIHPNTSHWLEEAQITKQKVALYGLFAGCAWHRVDLMADQRPSPQGDFHSPGTPQHMSNDFITLVMPIFRISSMHGHAHQVPSRSMQAGPGKVASTSKRDRTKSRQLCQMARLLPATKLDNRCKVKRCLNKTNSDAPRTDPASTHSLNLPGLLS